MLPGCTCVMKKGNPSAALDEDLLAHGNHRKRNSKHTLSEMIFFMEFQQVSKHQAATKELENSLSAQEFRI